MKLNIRLFILAAISFGCGLSFQYSNVIEFGDNYTESLSQRQHDQKVREIYRARTTGSGDAFEIYKTPASEFMPVEKYISDGRKTAITIAYALGGLSLIGGFLITGLDKKETQCKEAPEN